jgi:antitoxin ParD1/3/4
MQHRKTISLTAKDDAFIVGQVESGEYGNASEVVRAGLRLLEQEQLKLAALRQAIDEGDRDAKAGRTRSYQHGQLAERLKTRLETKPTPRRR